MKIVHICPYFPPHLGGAEQRIKELTEQLAKKSHQVEVFTSDIGCPNDKQLRSTKNLKIHYLPGWEFAHNPIISSLFNKILKASSKDSIWHIHIAQPLIPEIVWLASKITKIPYVVHIRIDAQPAGPLGFLLPLYKNIFLKQVLKDANKVIVLNQDYFNLIKDKYNIPEDKIRIIPNATKFNIVESKVFSKNNRINLLAVGRLGLQKNYLNLIKSISLLPVKIKKNIFLKIIGEGSQRLELTNLITELRLDQQVILKGRLEGKDLEDEYKKSDLFILASHREGFSTTLLEAMSKGLPIITTNVLGNRCVVKEDYNGYLCEIDAKSIAKIIKKMIKKRNEWSRFSKNNLQEVKKYSWGKIVKQTEDVYKEVLDEAAKNKKTK